MKDLLGITAIAMGVIIGIADIIWTYQSAYDAFWLALGIIILVADVIWIAIDLKFMLKKKK